MNDTTALWQRALEEDEQPDLAQDLREAIDAYIEKRKEMIGTGEP